MIRKEKLDKETPRTGFSAASPSLGKTNNKIYRSTYRLNTPSTPATPIPSIMSLASRNEDVNKFRRLTINDAILNVSVSETQDVTNWHKQPAFYEFI